MRLSSRETVSHHKELKQITEDELASALGTSQALIPEEGLLSTGPAPDKENMNLANTEGLLPHQMATMTLSSKPQTQTELGARESVLLYKQGVSDLKEYSEIPKNVKKVDKRKPHIVEENFAPMYEIAKMSFDQGVMKFDKLSNILR